MKSMLRNLQKRFFDAENSIQLVLFNIITLTGIVGGIFGFLISFACRMHIIQICAIFAALVVLCVCFFLANWKGRLKAAAVGIVSIITLVLYPIMFFTDGGALGGMGYWMALGVIFDFLLIEGAWFFILLVLQVVAILSCFVAGYFHPEIVVALENDATVYIDMIQSLLVLGIGVGIIIRFQNDTYKKAIREIQKKNAALEESERRAESASRAKSEFLSSMSHEIRTPLNAILGMNEMILREAEDAQILEYAYKVKNSSNALLSILNDVLDLTKIEAGKTELRTADYEVAELLRGSYTMIAERARKKNLKLVFSCDEELPRVLNGDMTRIRQILLNLLTNAVKYTREGTVCARFEGEQTRAGEILLRMIVSDTGIGMTKESLSRLYGKFERFDISRNQGIEGTGLGMSIVQELVTLMNGKIKAESEYGKGSVFTVTLPQRIVDQTPIGSLDATQGKKKERTAGEHTLFTAPDAHILLVDDMELNLEVTVSLLKETQIKIDTAGSGRACIALAQEKKYDLILMDHMMPEMDGIETLCQLRASLENKNQDTPVIMLTANALHGMRETYLAQGFADYLTKPVRYSALEEALFQYLPKEKIRLAEGAKKDEQERRGIEALFEALPSLDREMALTYCGGSKELLLGALRLYFQKERQKEMEESFQTQDWKTYEILVHSLKSTSLTVGLASLSEQAKALELAAKEGNTAYLKKEHEAVMQNYREILHILSRYLPEEDEEQDIDGDK